MAYFPKIPVRFRFFGDPDISRSFIGRGRKIAGELSRDMGFRKLRQGVTRRVVADGVAIHVTINHGITVVDIVANPGNSLDCFCYPCIGSGIITSLFAVVDEGTDEQQFQTYGIEVCQYNADNVVIDTDDVVFASSWVQYEVGQSVLLSILNNSTGIYRPDEFYETCCPEGYADIDMCSLTGSYQLAILPMVFNQ